MQHTEWLLLNTANRTKNKAGVVRTGRLFLCHRLRKMKNHYIKTLFAFETLFLRIQI